MFSYTQRITLKKSVVRRALKEEEVIIHQMNVYVVRGNFVIKKKVHSILPFG